MNDCLLRKYAHCLSDLPHESMLMFLLLLAHEVFSEM